MVKINSAPARQIVKIRRRWKINPKTRIKKSGKIYNRKKLKKSLKKESDAHD